jgi:predicted permease
MLQDLRFGARLLIKDRSFTATVLLTLAVCVGANAAMFSIVRSVLLKPLPVPDAARLVALNNSYPNAGAPVASNGVPDYYDRLRDLTSLQEQALYRRQGMTLGGVEAAERLSCVRATPSFYRIVQVTPAAGRIFTEDEGEEGKDKEAILGYATWRKRFAGDPSVIGKSIRLSGTNYEIVGVMPADFRFLWNDIDVWVPASFTAEQKSDESRHSNNWQMVGRLKPGATVAQVQQQLDALNARNDERFPQFREILKNAGFHSIAALLQDEVVRDVRPMLYLLWGAVLFVLLIGCVNITNLVVVRSSARARELATRQAIGAGFGRLARQLLTETMSLAVIGGALGLFAGWWALRSLPSLHIDQLPRGYEIALDPVSAAVVLGLAMLVGLLIGLVPVIHLARLNVNAALREEGRGGTSSRGTNLLRRGLATAQVTIAFVLLIGAGLLLASFRAVLRIDPGFDPGNVITTAISLPQTAYKDDAAVVSFLERALPAVQELPQVEHAGVTSQLPFGGDHSDSVIVAEGYTMKPGESLISPLQTVISAGYFETMRIPLVAGRYFDARDTADAPKTIIVDEFLARKFWAGRDPIGRRMYRPGSAEEVLKPGPKVKWITVVGVVKTVQMTDPADSFVPVGAYYTPIMQSPENGMMLAIRTRTDPGSVMPAVRQKINAIDPELPLYGVATMTSRMDDGFVGRRVPMLIGLGFGVVALMLAAIGIYGVLAYGVTQRRREIGIRMALGSTAREAFGLVLADGIRIVVVGLALGLAGAYFVGRAMRSQLYGVQPMDPRVVATVIGVLAIVALVAMILPARRAARVNPVVALNES